MASNPTANPNSEARKTIDTARTKGGADQNWKPPYYDGVNREFSSSGRSRAKGGRLDSATPGEPSPEPDRTGTKQRPKRYDGPRGGSS